MEKKDGIGGFLRKIFWFLGRKKAEEEASKKAGAEKQARKHARRTKLERKMDRWKVKVRELTKKVEGLEKQLRRRRISPQKALGVVQLVYGRVEREEDSIRRDTGNTKELMKRLEMDFYKRKLTEQEFRGKMLEYRERLHLLEMKGEELKREGSKIKTIGGSVRQVAMGLPVGRIAGVAAAEGGEAGPVFVGEAGSGRGTAKPVFAGETGGVARGGRAIKPVFAKESAGVAVGSVAGEATGAWQQEGAEPAKVTGAAKWPRRAAQTVTVAAAGRPAKAAGKAGKGTVQREGLKRAEGEVGQAERAAAWQPAKAAGRAAGVMQIGRVGQEIAAEAGGAQGAAGAAMARGAAARDAGLAIDVKGIIGEKAAGRVDGKRLAELEQKITELVGKYNLPREEVEQRVRDLDATRIIENFSKLISLIEMEHRAKGIAQKAEMPETADLGGLGMPKKGAEGIKGMAVELKKERIVTDLDRILSIVDERKKVKLGTMANELKIDKKKAEEYCEILEENGLVELGYPAIGDVEVRVVGYKKGDKGNKDAGAKDGKAKEGGGK